MRQHSCRVCGKELSDHGERRVLHSSANKDVLPVLEKFFSQGGINPTESCPIAGSASISAIKELKRVQELQNELQILDSKLKGKIGATYRVESIPVTFRVESIRDPRGNEYSSPVPVQCRLLLTIKVQACQLCDSRVKYSCKS